MKALPRDPFALSMQAGSKADKMVIGAYIPKPLSEQLAMRSLHSGVSRSKLIELALIHYMKTVSVNTEEIIFHLIKRTSAEWDSFRQANVKKEGWNEKEQFDSYKKQIRKSLTKRGISSEVIKKIMERI